MVSFLDDTARAALEAESQTRSPKISSADFNYSFSQDAEDEGVISIEEFQANQRPASTPAEQKSSSVADSSPVDHRTRVLYPEFKRRQRDSPHWTQGTHAGVTLDHVRDYLTWFGTLSPSNKHIADTAVNKIQKYFEKKNQEESAQENIQQVPESPTPDNSHNGIESIMETPVKHGSTLVSPAKAEKANTLPLKENKVLLNKPLEGRRMMSTSSAAYAKLELLTQKESLFADVKRKNDTNEMKEPEVKRVQAVTLSEEQNQVIELARQGHNLFYTGSAGTGKSLLLRSLIKSLKKQHPLGSVGVTASTGLAACNIGGQTLHSFTGIGLGDAPADKLVKKIKRNPKMKERWRDLEVLVIDEVSMIDAALFDKLDMIAREMRKRRDVPFGGLQLVICGDFYQLPPVTKHGEPVFAFESQAWKQAIKYTIVLKKVFRQQSDRDFINMLNEVRNGNVSEATARKFRALSRPLASKEGVIPAKLFPTRREVDRANSTMLKQLPGAEVVFRAFDGGSLTDEDQRQRLLSSFLAPERIALKKDAQVMLIKNMDETLVNGSLGKIVDFIDPDTYTHYRSIKSDKVDIKTLEEKAANSMNKGPSKRDEKHLIENSTVLESQLDENVFSFLKELKEEQPEDLPESAQRNIERKIELLNQLYSSSKNRRMPLVRFIQADGTTREVLIEPETFSLEDEFDRPIVSRTQIPLILAWSLSIHKSQGQTLPLVQIDLRNIFERGQAYVALSRATHRRGLQVRNFNPSRILTHEKVVAFYDSLMTVDEIKDREESKRKTTGFVSGTQLNRLENLADNVADAGDFVNEKDNVIDEFDSVWSGQ
ncbi:hypothetical protein KL921_004890 [Ogataea angusta]|uniref:ATP-dependent DNA helicase PIF1 n=1 Tax=Pichia angusta TaxID=870730 RepID=A0ABQ7RSC4_PICAN|nr:hypothetical protein KL921_004890 [Ogataea angusta]KAG7820568.1 hypothetical protein KL909_004440 [Ogataea angusta]KAG7826956.1 hypothetical protein KL920_004954 [Ogataea angusta]KAG7836787.1 hypothetical protein KL942_004705 [Ogataea angusta]KAG7842587.1 hypothetical protein KL941_004963 [Ogataea angusta]